MSDKLITLAKILCVIVGISFSLICWLLFGEPAEFGKNRTLRFSGHP
ncbi:hypothetical protein GQE30_20905 [Escherichia coli]|nr:hypothetical protein [Escherichia coli]MWE59058.1 hypothetical protein [Escherichia coli]MWF21966.1 hypothetical protein [Escherichia coli]